MSVIFIVDILVLTSNSIALKGQTFKNCSLCIVSNQPSQVCYCLRISHCTYCFLVLLRVNSSNDWINHKQMHSCMLNRALCEILGGSDIWANNILDTIWISYVFVIFIQNRVIWYILLHKRILKLVHTFFFFFWFFSNKLHTLFIHFSLFIFFCFVFLLFFTWASDFYQKT